MIKTLTMLLLLLGKAVWADPVATFGEGVRLYDARDYAGAVQAFESILAAGQANGDTYFNLGNSYFRLEKYGKAILNYERALRYRPNDHDLMQNLTEARRHVVDRIEPTLRLVIWDWLDGFRNSLNVFTLAIVFWSLGGVTALLVAWRWLRPLGAPAWLRQVTVICVALFALSAIWYSWNVKDFLRRGAVVLAEKSDVYSAPDSGAKQLFTLHEGTSVVVAQDVSGWLNVRLSDGREGWLRQTDVELL